MVKRHPVIVVALLVTALSAVACGGKSPTGPSSVEAPGATQTPEPAPAPSPTGSAVITGTVVAPGSTVSMGASLAGIAGVKVSVAGTSVSAIADGRGKFTLQNVPSGDRQLEFSGAGANARLPLDDVSEQERIDLTVAVAGSSAELVSQSRSTGSEAQVEGLVDAIDAGARTLQIGSLQVSVPEGVPIRHGSTALQFSDLHVGDRVHVKGSKSGSVVTASEVNVQQGQATPGGKRDAKVEGTVSGLGGTCPNLRFQVDGTGVVTSASTQFKGGTCTSLEDGMTVEVEGSTSDGTITAMKVEVEDAPGQEGVTLKGTLSGLSGQCPALTFTLQGTTVTTSAATVFKKGTCGDVSAGAAVKAEGVLASGTLAATRVSFEGGPKN